jgi:hypothetical protein
VNVSSLSVATALLATLLVILGTAKLLALAPMRAAAAHVGLSVSTYRIIGALELSAAMGLVAGGWWQPSGLLSAAGVVMLMTGAVMAHIRAGDGFHRAVPAVCTAALTISYVALLTGVNS